MGPYRPESKFYQKFSPIPSFIALHSKGVFNLSYKLSYFKKLRNAGRSNRIFHAFGELILLHCCDLSPKIETILTILRENR